jgi:hypothetical protein
LHISLEAAADAAERAGPCAKGIRSDFEGDVDENKRWIFAGEGERTSFDCCEQLLDDHGQPMWLGCTEDDSHSEPVIKFCGDMACSAERSIVRKDGQEKVYSCASNYINRLATDATNRMMVASAAYGKAPRHFVVGIPRDLWSSYDKNLMIRKVWHQLCLRVGGPRWMGGMYDGRKIGFVGSLIIFHPYRFRDSYTGQGVSWRIYQLDPEGQYQRYYAPHLHLVAFGEYPDSVVMAREHDLIIKDKGPRPTRKQLFTTIAYHLSHAGLSMTRSIRKQRRWYHHNRIPVAKEKLDNYREEDVYFEDVVQEYRDKRVMSWVGILSPVYMGWEWSPRDYVRCRQLNRYGKQCKGYLTRDGVRIEERSKVWYMKEGWDIRI